MANKDTNFKADLVSQLPELPIPRRVHRVASHLSSLPMELVEPVISQLQTSRILELAILSARLREIILTNKDWKHLFKSKSLSLPVARAGPPGSWVDADKQDEEKNREGAEKNMLIMLKLYASWLLLHQVSASTYLRPFYDRFRNVPYDRWQRVRFRQSVFFMFGAESERTCRSKDVGAVLREELGNLYSRVHDVEFEGGRVAEIVSRDVYAKTVKIAPDVLPLRLVNPANADNLLQKALAMNKLQDAFNKAKSEELIQLAEIMEKHPSRLKRLLNPYEGPEPETSKREAGRMRLSAKKILRAKVFAVGDHTAGSWFLSYRLPIIPRDVCLHIFVRCLKEHPVHSYEYPPEVRKDLEIVLEGLKKIYIDPDVRSTCNKPEAIAEPKMRIHLRLEDPKWDNRGCEDVHGPITSVEDIRRLSFALPTTYDYERCTLTEPHDPRELAWLKSFMTCVEYFDKTFPEIAAELQKVDIPHKYCSLMNFYSKREEKKERRKEAAEQKKQQREWREQKEREEAQRKEQEKKERALREAEEREKDQKLGEAREASWVYRLYNPGRRI